jgi:hypothetical protein
VGNVRWPTDVAWEVGQISAGSQSRSTVKCGHGSPWNSEPTTAVLPRISSNLAVSAWLDNSDSIYGIVMWSEFLDTDPKIPGTTRLPEKYWF